MEALIANFRGGRHTKSDNQMILTVSGIDTKEKAKKLLGKKVTWESSSGKKIEGKITKEHGNSGALKVHFERGMPGQSIGSKVKIE